MKKVLIIAEAGVNHNGSIELAKQLIDAAAKSGADYVKFQTFKADKLVSKNAPKAAYQKENMPSEGDTQYEMLKRLELSEAMHEELRDYCNSKSIKFLSTGFDVTSIEYLDRFGVDFFKIPSGEITNRPYLEQIGSYGKKVILSTGMASLNEIGVALETLEKSGTDRSLITVLHCNTEYPTPMCDVNLKAMITIKEKYNVEVGYSDHTNGIEVPIAATAIGAVVIEKHFTIDRSLPGPDHRASLVPEELSQMISAIRNIEVALGSGVKEPSPSEQKNIKAVRKSIHIANDLAGGHVIKDEDIIIKRPGNGISPMDLDKVIGKKLNKAMQGDSILRWDDLLA